MGVEGSLINNEKFRGPKLQIPQFHFKMAACARAEERRQGSSPTMRPIRQNFGGPSIEIVPLGLRNPLKVIRSEPSTVAADENKKPMAG